MYNRQPLSRELVDASDEFSVCLRPAGTSECSCDFIFNFHSSQSACSLARFGVGKTVSATSTSSINFSRGISDGRNGISRTAQGKGGQGDLGGAGSAGSSDEGRGRQRTRRM